MYQTEYITFILTAFGIVVTFLIGIILFFVQIRNRRKIQIQNEKLLAETYEKQLLEQSITAQQETMEQIGKELHDNIAQQLVLISMALYSNKADNKNAGILIENCIQELRQLSKSLTDHKMQADSLYDILVKEKEKIESYTNFKIAVLFDDVSIDFAHPLAKVAIVRVVQEFIQNSLKHSKGDAITINCKKMGTHRYFELYDNGVGYPETERAGQGIGLINIKKRLSGFAENLTIGNKDAFGASISFTLINNLHEKPRSIGR